MMNMSDPENITETEENNIAIDLELERFSKQSLFMNRIHELYLNVMTAYRNGGLLIYNPDIFANLTEQQFIDWILENNQAVADAY